MKTVVNKRKPFAIEVERKKKVKVESDPSLLLDLPSEILRLVFSWLDTKSAGRSVRTCKTINNFFQPDLDKEAVAQAHHCAAFGEKNKLAEMLKKRPGLAYIRGTTLDPCGRTVEGTVYQIALGAKDVSPFPDQFGEMVEMIEGHLTRLPQGEDEIELQKAEQFPEGWEEQERARQEADSKTLNEVFKVIDVAATIEEAEKAADKFQEYLKKQTEGIITTGYHFNEKLFQEAFELADHRIRNGYQDSPKNTLIAIKIIGGIQRYFPANLAQAACDGFGTVTEGEKKPLSRSMLLNDKKTSFFDPNLGVSHFVSSYWMGGSASRVHRDRAEMRHGRLACSKLMSSKNSNLRDRQIPRLSQKNRRNVIHHGPQG